MNLAKDYLQAISDIVTKAVDSLALRTAAGFAEVHEKIEGLTQDMSEVKDRTGRIEQIVSAEARLMDQQEGAIKNIRQQLKAV